MPQKVSKAKEQFQCRDYVQFQCRKNLILAYKNENSCLLDFDFYNVKSQLSLDNVCHFIVFNLIFLNFICYLNYGKKDHKYYVHFFITRAALVPFITDETINTYVGMTTIGSSGGIAYQPGVCTSEKFLRTAIIKSYTDLETGEVNKHFEVTLIDSSCLNTLFKCEKLC